MSCPFVKEEEEDEEDDPDEDDKAVREFPQIIPLAERRRGADSVRGANVVDFVNAVAQGETRKALERMAAFERIQEGGLSFIPTASQLGSALSSNTAQGIFAVLAALATIAAMRRGQGGSLAMRSLAVPRSERLVAERLGAVRQVREAGESQERIRRFFGFGPTAGIDSFSETGFN